MCCRTGRNSRKRRGRHKQRALLALMVLAATTPPAAAATMRMSCRSRASSAASAYFLWCFDALSTWVCFDAVCHDGRKHVVDVGNKSLKSLRCTVHCARRAACACTLHLLHGFTPPPWPSSYTDCGWRRHRMNASSCVQELGGLCGRTCEDAVQPLPL